MRVISFHVGCFILPARLVHVTRMHTCTRHGRQHTLHICNLAESAKSLGIFRLLFAAAELQQDDLVSHHRADDLQNEFKRFSKVRRRMFGNPRTSART
jgi:hypothetical protein